MPIIHNGTTINNYNKVVFNGTTIDSVVFNGTNVYQYDSVRGAFWWCDSCNQSSTSLTAIGSSSLDGLSHTTYNGLIGASHKIIQAAGGATPSITFNGTRYVLNFSVSQPFLVKQYSESPPYYPHGSFVVNPGDSLSFRENAYHIEINGVVKSTPNVDKVFIAFETIRQ